MAFSGHTGSDGKVVWREEIYSGSTRITAPTLSSPSNQSEQSEPSEKSEQSKPLGMESHNYLPPQRWEHLNLRGAHNLLYDDQGESSSSSSAPLSLPPARDSTYIHGNHNTDSLYSWTEMYGSLKQMESQSNVVPSLELHSKTSTLDYLRELGGLKLDREPQVAYETWYASKQRLRQQELQRQKEQREKKQKEEEKRKNLAKICYEKWLNDKARQATQKRLQNRVQRTDIQSSSSITSGSSSSKPVRDVSQSEIRQVVQSWWHKKQEQQQRQRLERQRHMQKKERESQRRKKLASMAWQKWMSNVYDKPKPVPMNQGIDSLRGTVSQIYINPVPWKPLKKASEEH
ncbi:coiled-coil domain-containing protein 34 [Drosophila innubila]|uniref:coiled-coil domain-containing protein 34 n=1 Tax=Drosophila innubila TaxID=198719 RepID=UPI00148E56BD|nr:coiled-coil domain-containing protein 34 [Drosophila innubila]